MAKREYLNNTREADVNRSTEAIRQDIAKEKDNISQTVGQISERLKEKLDWRGYVKESPYWSMGAAAGLGYLASRMLRTRPTYKERIMRSVADEVRDSLGVLHARVASRGLITVTLLGIATKVATRLIKNATSTAAASGNTRLDHRQNIV